MFAQIQKFKCLVSEIQLRLIEDLASDSIIYGAWPPDRQKLAAVALLNVLACFIECILRFSPGYLRIFSSKLGFKYSTGYFCLETIYRFVNQKSKFRNHNRIFRNRNYKTSCKEFPRNIVSNQANLKLRFKKSGRKSKRARICPAHRHQPSPGSKTRINHGW